MTSPEVKSDKMALKEVFEKYADFVKPGEENDITNMSYRNMRGIVASWTKRLSEKLTPSFHGTSTRTSFPFQDNVQDSRK